MHRIDGPGHVQNRFSSGNPQAGQQATVVTAEFLNDVQENLVHVLEQAGIAPVKGAVDQLYLALVTIASGAQGGTEPAPGDPATPSVPTTRQVGSGGLVKGGGTLANDLKLNVDIASVAEINTGTANDRAITPAGLAAAAGALFQTNGYMRLPGGAILQWGQATALVNASTVVTLPVTFPAACLFAVCSGGATTGNAQDNNPIVVGRGLGSISIYSARDQGTPVNWFALGF